jgi:hypothetical protein
MRRYELRADQWLKIAALLLGKATDQGWSGQDNRQFIQPVPLLSLVGQLLWYTRSATFGSSTILQLANLHIANLHIADLIFISYYGSWSFVDKSNALPTHPQLPQWFVLRFTENHNLWHNLDWNLFYCLGVKSMLAMWSPNFLPISLVMSIVNW